MKIDVTGLITLASTTYDKYLVKIDEGVCDFLMF